MGSPSMFCMLIIFVCICESFVCGQFPKFRKIGLPAGASGPEAPTYKEFNLIRNPGVYTTVVDGRILRWSSASNGFVDFAYTSPQRTKQACDNTTDPNMGPICGRPVGLAFHPATGLLYIADAYFGLLFSVFGGRANRIATYPDFNLKFVSGVDLDLNTYNPYFTDASMTYTIRDIEQPGFQTDSTGRLFVYRQRESYVSLLMSGLSGPGSPAVSRDGTFVLVPELTGKRIIKYWLAGPKRNTSEVLLNLDGNPHCIKRAGAFGQFWVAMSKGYIPRTNLITPQGLRIASNGTVLETVSFANDFFNKTVNMVYEREYFPSVLYVGSSLTDFIGVYSRY